MKKSIACLLLGVMHLDSIGKIGWRATDRTNGAHSLRRAKHDCGPWPETCCIDANLDKCKSCPGQCLAGNAWTANCDDKNGCSAENDCSGVTPTTSTVANQVISRFGVGSENFDFPSIFFPGNGGPPPCLGAA